MKETSFKIRGIEYNLLYWVNAGKTKSDTFKVDNATYKSLKKMIRHFRVGDTIAIEHVVRPVEEIIWWAKDKQCSIITNSFVKPKSKPPSSLV